MNKKRKKNIIHYSINHGYIFTYLYE
jgi:hypothetical protein